MIASHLDNETLAVMAEGRLEEAARAAAIAHLSDCARCRERLAETLHFLAEDAPQDQVPASVLGRRRWWPVLAAAAACLFLAVWVPWLRKPAFNPDLAYRSLAQAVSREAGYRTVRFRLPQPVPEDVVATRSVVRAGGDAPATTGPEYTMLSKFWRDKGREDPEGVLHLVSCALLAGHYAEAYDAALSAQTRWPDRPDLGDLVLVSGYALMRDKGRQAEAADILSRLKSRVALRPRDADLVYNTAVIAWESKDPEAGALAARYRELQPEGPHAAFLAGL